MSDSDVLKPSHWRCIQCDIRILMSDERAIANHLLSQKHQWKSRETAPWLKLVSRCAQIRLGRDFARTDLLSLIEWLRQHGEVSDLVVCCSGRDFPSNSKQIPVPRGTSLVAIFSTPATATKLLAVPSRWLTGGTEFDLCRLDPPSVSHTIIASSMVGPSPLDGAGTTGILAANQRAQPPAWQSRLDQLLSPSMSGGNTASAETLMLQMRSCLLLSTQQNVERLQFCQRLQEYISQCLRVSCVLHPFGSCVNGLAFVDSDLDVFAEFAGVNVTTSLPPVAGAEKYSGKVRRALARKQLQRRQMAGAGVATGAQMAKQLANALRVAPRNLVSGAVAIANATVPIVRVNVPAPLHCQCDISFSNEMGRCNSLLLYELLRADERVHMLAVCIRAWSRVWQVSGGDHFSPKKLSSFCLTLLVIVYVQQLEQPLLPSVAHLQRSCTDGPFVDGWNVGFDVNCLSSFVNQCGNRSSPVDLLYGFFQFCGRLDHEKIAVSPFLGAVIERTLMSPDNNDAPIEFRQWFRKMALGTAQLTTKYVCVMVQDPFNLSCNVARNLTLAGLRRFRIACRLSSRMSFSELFSAENVQLLDKSTSKKAEDKKGKKRSLQETAESVDDGDDSAKRKKPQEENVIDSHVVKNNSESITGDNKSVPSTTTEVQMTKKRSLSSTEDPTSTAAPKKKPKRVKNCDEVDEDAGAEMSVERCTYDYWQRVTLNHLKSLRPTCYIQLNLKNSENLPFPRVSGKNSTAVNSYELRLQHVASARALAALVQDVLLSVMHVSYYAFDFCDGTLSRRSLDESSPTVMAVGETMIALNTSASSGPSGGSGDGVGGGNSCQTSIASTATSSGAGTDSITPTVESSSTPDGGAEQQPTPAVAATPSTVCNSSVSTESQSTVITGEPSSTPSTAAAESTQSSDSAMNDTARSVDDQKAETCADPIGASISTADKDVDQEKVAGDDQKGATCADSNGVSTSTADKDLDQEKSMRDDQKAATCADSNGASVSTTDKDLDQEKVAGDDQKAATCADSNGVSVSTTDKDLDKEKENEKKVMEQLNLPLGRVVAAMKCTVHAPVWHRRRHYGVFSKHVKKPTETADASQSTDSEPPKKPRSRDRLVFERESTQLALNDGLEVDVAGMETFRCYVVLGDQMLLKDPTKPLDTSQAIIYIYRGVVAKGPDHVSTLYHFIRPLIRDIAASNNYVKEFGGHCSGHNGGQ